MMDKPPAESECACQENGHPRSFGGRPNGSAENRSDFPVLITLQSSQRAHLAGRIFLWGSKG
jgi:hypothetical protein